MENFRHNAVKTYCYPTVANPHITMVTLRGGHIISGLGRVKKF